MSSVSEDIRTEKAIRIAMNMIISGKISLEEIAEYTELPIERVKELAEKKTA